MPTRLTFVLLLGTAALGVPLAIRGGAMHPVPRRLRIRSRRDHPAITC